MLSHLQHCRPGAGASVNLTARPFPDADSLAELLRLHGHSVRVAHDPMTALAIAAELRPEVAVLDIGLPIMDGYELAERLRGSLSTARSPSQSTSKSARNCWTKSPERSAGRRQA